MGSKKKEAPPEQVEQVEPVEESPKDVLGCLQSIANSLEILADISVIAAQTKEEQPK